MRSNFDLVDQNKKGTEAPAEAWTIFIMYYHIYWGPFLPFSLKKAFVSNQAIRSLVPMKKSGLVAKAPTATILCPGEAGN